MIPVYYRNTKYLTMKDLIHLVAFAYIPCFLALPALAQQASETITPAPSATPSTAGILRPSSGETITVGEPYTIRWTPPPFDTGPLAIELFGRVNSIHRILPNTTSCDGWLINTQCDKLDVNISSGSTSYGANSHKLFLLMIGLPANRNSLESLEAV